MEDGFISYHTRPDGQRYFTNSDMARMVEQGLIDPDDRWELIRGAWYDMGSEGFEHMDLRTRILREMTLQMGRRSDVLISTEGSIYFSRDTGLRPDLIIYRADVGTNEMTGDDIFLIAEIMKSSHQRDRVEKLPVYAAAGVPEVWLIDLDARQVDAARAPVRDSESYSTVQRREFNDKLTPSNFPNISIVVSAL
ncbi:MAG: Uma2 family endonuclease [Pseudomonadota bacterium]